MKEKLFRQTPLRAIRRKCLDCSCFQAKEVNLCPIPECSLFSYRFGHNPARQGVGPRTVPKGLESAVEPVNSRNAEVLNG